jgi:hypothetical protein
MKLDDELKELIDEEANSMALKHSSQQNLV